MGLPNATKINLRAKIEKAPRHEVLSERDKGITFQAIVRDPFIRPTDLKRLIPSNVSMTIIIRFTKAQGYTHDDAQEEGTQLTGSVARRSFKLQKPR